MVPSVVAGEKSRMERKYIILRRDEGDCCSISLSGGGRLSTAADGCSGLAGEVGGDE